MQIPTKTYDNLPKWAQRWFDIYVFVYVVLVSVLLVTLPIAAILSYTEELLPLLIANFLLAVPIVFVYSPDWGHIGVRVWEEYQRTGCEETFHQFLADNYGNISRKKKDINTLYFEGLDDISTQYFDEILNASAEECFENYKENTDGIR